MLYQFLLGLSGILCAADPELYNPCFVDRIARLGMTFDFWNKRSS
jgi:hypothetical protein